jgi:2-hydroxy-6-oxo-6-(2'-aminophenyl)hexa-2,4-dienoate hydrolase
MANVTPQPAPKALNDAIWGDNPIAKARPEGKLLTAKGLTTHFIEMGEGVPTILIHGGGAGADGWGNWRKCLPLFAESVRAIAIDLVGFGLSDKPDPAHFVYSQDARDEQLTHFIEALDAGPVNIVGNSTGGLTAMGAAIRRPDLVNKVVLMGSAGIETGIITPLKALTEYDFSPAGMRRIISSLANPAFEVEEALVDYRHKLSIEPGVRAGYSAFMRWIGEQGGLHRPEDFIAQVKVPSLVVHGKEDRVVPLASGHRLLELIEHSWGYIVPHCGHWAMMEHPRDFTRATLNFLQD